MSTDEGRTRGRVWAWGLVWGLLVLAGGWPALAQDEDLTVEQILERIDRQMTVESRKIIARMIIIRPDETREKSFRAYARGPDQFFLLFLEPARDKGTKILKMDNNVWIYFDRTEKMMKMSGHMLRQSLMGSDFSYEDMIENRALLADYDARLLGLEAVNGEPCYVMELVEKTRGLSYPKRKIWVSKASFLPIREERFAKTGQLLKVSQLEDVVQYEDRNYPRLFVMEDKLKEGSRTEMHIDAIEFQIPLPAEVFDKQNLPRDIQLP